MFKNFEKLIQEAKTFGRRRLVVAAADDEVVLKAVQVATEAGIVDPVLVGDQSKIDALAKTIGFTEYEVVNQPDSVEASQEAVRIVHNDPQAVLMKGLVNTSVYLRAVLNREYGLRDGRLLSLLAVYQIPGYHKLLFCTDSGVNVDPDLEQKKAIVQNALGAMKRMGFQTPKGACLAANELVDPKIPSTVHAAALAEMAKTGELPDCILEGPVAFDVAFDQVAARHKGITSQVAGDVDLLVFPNMETGNALGKSWLHFNQAQWGGIILGATNPVVLGSRSDSVTNKLNSIALACLAVNTDQIGGN